MKTEITLPIELYKLGLEEIGAIFVLMSTPYMDERFIKYWVDHESFNKALLSLKNEEIIVDKPNGELVIDLTWV